jgi:hypothetical protein
MVLAITELNVAWPLTAAIGPRVPDNVPGPDFFVNVTGPVKLVTTLLLESTRPTTIAGLIAVLINALEGCVRNLKLQPPVTVVWMDEVGSRAA